MLMTILVILVVSGALIIGALWGIYGSLSKKTKGFLVALAGGALMVSAILELVEPAINKTNINYALIFFFLGAIMFTGLDYLVDKKWAQTTVVVFLLQ